MYYWKWLKYFCLSLDSSSLGIEFVVSLAVNGILSVLLIILLAFCMWKLRTQNGMYHVIYKLTISEQGR